MCFEMYELIIENTQSGMELGTLCSVAHSYRQRGIELAVDVGAICKMALASRHYNVKSVMRSKWKWIFSMDFQPSLIRTNDMEKGYSSEHKNLRYVQVKDKNLYD